MTHSILLPPRLDSSKAAALIDCARRIQGEAALIVDARNVEFASPYGLVTLGAAALRRLLENLPALEVQEPKNAKVCEFLKEVRFWELLRDGTTVPRQTLTMQRLSSTSFNNLYASEAAALIRSRVPGTSEHTAELIQTNLSELLQNVIEHARSSTDVVVLSRWYARESNVRIAMADSGVGIPTSMRRNSNFRNEADDLALVRRAATEKHATGRADQRFGGLGLKRLLQNCREHSGSVQISTASVFAWYSSRRSSEVSVPLLDGTTVEFNFRPSEEDHSSTSISPTEFF